MWRRLLLGGVCACHARVATKPEVAGVKIVGVSPSEIAGTASAELSFVATVAGDYLLLVESADGSLNVLLRGTCAANAQQSATVPGSSLAVGANTVAVLVVPPDGSSAEASVALSRLPDNGTPGGAITLTLSPMTASSGLAAPTNFVANVDGSASNAVTWSIQETGLAGSVVAGVAAGGPVGIYTSPLAPGVFHVVATSTAQPTVSATATVTVGFSTLSLWSGLLGGPGSIDGVGATARFNYPSGLDHDSAGNLYVADASNCTVRKIAPDGTTTTLAGDARANCGGAPLDAPAGPGSAARFIYPEGVAVTADGSTLYVGDGADAEPTRIVKIQPNANPVTVAAIALMLGAEPAPNLIRGLALSADEKTLYFMDAGTFPTNIHKNNRVRQVNVDTTSGAYGTLTTIAGTGALATEDIYGSCASVVLYDLNNHTNEFVSGLALFNGTLLFNSPIEDRIDQITGWGTPGCSVSDFSGAVPARSITITAVASALYSVSVNSVQYQYPSGPTDTVAEIAAGLTTALSGVATTSGSAPFLVTVSDPSLAYTISVGANLTLTAIGGNFPDNLVNGSSVTSQYSGLAGIAVDPVANVMYATDYYNERIRKVDASGNATDLGQFGVPVGITLSPDRTSVYFSDLQTMAVRNLVVSPPAAKSTAFAGADDVVLSVKAGALSAMRFEGVNDLALTPAGDVLIPDSDDGALLDWSPATQTSTTLASGITCFEPFAVSADANGTYVSSPACNTLFWLDANGSVILQVGSHGYAGGDATSAEFNAPNGVVTDGAGNVYLADMYNNVIRKIVFGLGPPATATVTTVQGGQPPTAPSPGFADAPGGLPAIAAFSQPTGLALDTVGDLFVADTGNQVIRKIVLVTGAVTTIAGLPHVAGSADGSAGSGGLARFNNPNRLFLDGAGNLYVSDSGNYAIRMIENAVSGQNMQVVTVVGVPGGWAGVQLGPLPANLNLTNGVVLMPDGQLLIASENAIVSAQ